MATNTQALEKAAQPASGLRRFLHSEAARNRIVEALVSRYITPERMVSLAMMAATADERVAKSTPESVLFALVQASQLGLEPNGVSGEAYIIARWNKNRGVFEAHLQPGYRGLQKLMVESGKVTHIACNIVREGDTFEMEEGSVPKLVYRRNLVQKNRGDIVGVYAVAYLRDAPHGFHPFVYMPVEDVNRIRDTYSQAGEAGPWKSEYEEMAKKTCIIRLAKTYPVSRRSQEAAVIGEYHSAGIDTVDEVAASAERERDAEVIDVPPVAASKVESLKAEIEAKKAQAPAQKPASKPETAAGAAGAQADVVTETVTGRIMSPREKTDKKGRKYVICTVEGVKGSLTTWSSAGEHLLKGRGQEATLQVTRDGDFMNLYQIVRIGATEFHEGVPVINARQDVEPQAGESEPPQIDDDPDFWQTGRE